MKIPVLYCLLLSAAVMFSACGSSNNPSDSGNTNTSTNLIVSVTSPDVIPNVKVIGQGRTYSISSTDTLKNVKPGNYIIIAYRVDQEASGSALVGKSFGIMDPVRQIQIKEGETKNINIVYEELPASGKQWISDDNGSSLLAFDKSALSSPGSPTASVKIKFSYEGLRGFAFDRMGDLWVAGFSSNHIYAFSPGQLTGITSANPVVTFSNNSISGPYGLIFDKEGNLWISDWNSGNLISYNENSLLNILIKSGSVTNSPDIQITSAKLESPEFMTFDSNSNLWLAGKDPSSSKSEIVEFLSSSLKSSGDITPAIIITESSQPTLINVTGLAFDKSGNLWGTDGNSFFRFSSNQLTTSGATVPQLYRSVPAPALLIGLSFDAQGNLWLGETYAPRIMRYTYPNSGYGTTYNTSNDLKEPSWIVFFPSPKGYPIY